MLTNFSETKQLQDNIEAAANIPLPQRTRVRYTKHALLRMQQRRVPVEGIWLVIGYGREFRDRDADIFVVGAREVEFYKPFVDLSGLEGVHVVFSRGDHVLMTVYRNKDFHHKSFATSERYRRFQRRSKERRRVR